MLAFNPLLNSEGQMPPVEAWVALAALALIAWLWFTAKTRRRRR
jgi:hypothetical protein